MRAMKNLMAAVLIGLPVAAAAETALLMAEEAGCIWCARWNAEVGDAYEKTAEGRAAPLERYDIHEGAPEGVELARRVVFTPTFILVRDGQEIDRIEGYPGEDFFWGLLNIMLEKADISVGNTG
jgi:thioredoxin-related protein